MSRYNPAVARLAFKPDSSFFSKIVAGAVGARAVSADLATRGHDMRELERGSTTIKLWKDVKRKRVRIPDLVCVRCGLRVESRAKKDPQLSLSHSTVDAERAWDFGFVDNDVIAFPVTVATDEQEWRNGQLDDWSYWHERDWLRWEVQGAISYLPVRSFRSAVHAKSATKGVTEGSENFLTWDAVFSSRTGSVESIVDRGVKVKRAIDGHCYTWKISPQLTIHVKEKQKIENNEIIAATVKPSTPSELDCPKKLPGGHIAKLLQSKERTQRFTAIKLARLIGDGAWKGEVEKLTRDSEEDIYIRIEGAAYLVSVCGFESTEVFEPFLGSIDEQTQLEAIIALGETKTDRSVRLLGNILKDGKAPYFMRAAAAWSLSQLGGKLACERLVKAFADESKDVRDDALQAVVAIGGPTIPVLIVGLQDGNDIAAGCAEALRRQQRALDISAIKQLGETLRRTSSTWPVWLAGNLPKEKVGKTLEFLQKEKPDVHFAVTVLWAFVESWIAAYWDANSGATPPTR